MSQGTWVLVAALVLATAFGTWRAARDGRFRGTRALPTSEAPVQAAPAADSLLDGLGHELGERATLLQFSSAFCAPCRATRRVLGEVVDGGAGGRATSRSTPSITSSWSGGWASLRTPTTLVLDARGQEVTRASGAPSRDAVLGTLGRVAGPAAVSRPHVGTRVRMSETADFRGAPTAA